MSQINQHIKLIIFDLDRTLFDWDEAQQLARNKVNELFAGYLNPAQFWTIYNELHEDLFQSFLDRKLSLNEYRLYRYLKPLQRLGVNDEFLATRLNECFLKNVLQSTLFCAGAEDVLNYCQNLDVKLILLTNGPADGQYQKIQRLSLDHWFNAYYISEEKQVAKPESAAFLNICQDFAIQPQECLMVGDDFEIDILPAAALGFKIFWVGNQNVMQRAGLKKYRLIELIPYLMQLNGAPNPSEI